MTIIQLEYLLAVANCGEFFAGRRTLLRDPAVAEHAGQGARRGSGASCCLTVRRNPVIPTEAGEVVLEQARGTRAYGDYIRGRSRAEGRDGVNCVWASSDHRALPVASSSRRSCAIIRRWSWKSPRWSLRTSSRRSSAAASTAALVPAYGTAFSNRSFSTTGFSPMFRARESRSTRTAEHPHRGHRPERPR